MPSPANLDLQILIDYFEQEGLRDLDATDNLCPRAPLIEDHLHQQNDTPVPIMRAEVMLEGWDEDEYMPSNEQEKALDLMGSTLMGNFRLNMDLREQNPQTGIETQRDTMTINLAVLNLGNHDRKPAFAGKQKFDKELREDMNRRPLGNLIFRNPARIILLNEASYVKENFECLCDSNQCTGARCSHALGYVPIACFIRGHAASGCLVELIRHFSGSQVGFGWTLHTATFRGVFGDKFDDGNTPEDKDSVAKPKPHPHPISTTRCS